MRRFFLSYKRDESGQGMVEFAIILPLFLLLLLGLIQFGFFFNGQITLTSAAREGARLAVVESDDTLVKDRVEEGAIALLLKVERDEIVIDRTLPEGMLSVTVDGTVEIIMPLLSMVVGDFFPLSGESKMRIEYE